MPTDRVILEFITVANQAGLTNLKSSLFGVSLATAGLTAALGAAVFIGKAAIDNTEAMDKAHLSLQQATRGSKRSFEAMQTAFDQWAEANKRFIPDQYAAETALAAFVRAGNNAKDSMRMLNDALDLSTVKGVDMATAQQQIELAVMGNARALKALGIDTAAVTKIMHSHLTAEQKHHAILALIEAKTKDGRKATTELTQSTQALNKDWQDITTKIGPPLLALFSGTVGWVDKLVKGLDDLGHNKSWNANVSKFLGTIQDSIIQDVKWVEMVIGDIQRLGNYLSGQGNGRPVGSVSPFPGKAGGGSVQAGQAYTVGEQGPETLVMGGQGGSIIPNGAGGGVHLHFHDAVYADGPGLDRLTTAIAQRLRMTTGI